MEDQKQRPKGTTPARFSETFKKAVIEEYLRTGTPKAQIQSKYGIKFRSAINTWMENYGYTDPYQNNPKLALITESEMAQKHISTIQSPSDLEAKIKLLEKQLDDERLRADMYNRMIDLAEKTYKIPVRKNFNTK